MKKLTSLVLILSIVCFAVFVSEWAQRKYHPVRATNSTVERVVSLAPSVTEVLFAVGADSKVVGVTRYCTFPPKAMKIAQVGGYIDPSFEAILRLKPDLVVITNENSDNGRKLHDLGVNVLSVDHNSIEGIIDSISTIGKEVGEESSADRLALDIRRRVRAISQRTKDLERPSVLISVGRSMGGGIDEIYGAGKGNFYDEIIGISGGRNAYDDRLVKTPALSEEGVTRLNPDVIIDLEPSKSPSEAVTAAKGWASLKDVSAVRRRRVCVLRSDYVVIPGPRFIDTLEDIAKAVHPEVDWSRQ